MRCYKSQKALVTNTKYISGYTFCDSFLVRCKQTKSDEHTGLKAKVRQ